MLSCFLVLSCILTTVTAALRLRLFRLVKVADLHLRILPKLYRYVDVMQHLADAAMRGGE